MEAIGTFLQGPRGQGGPEKIDKFCDTLQLTPHMPHFAALKKRLILQCFKKVCSEVWGTLRRGPWGLGEADMGKNHKILNGLGQTLEATPLLLCFAAFL